MKKFISFTALLSLNFLLCAQTFEDFITYINNIPNDERQAEVDSFLNTEQSYPITEDTLAHFIYSGTCADLAVPGDFSGWNPDSAPLTNITGTNFWYRTYTFENNARLDYKFFYNGSTWILDPLNPLTVPGGFGNNSELRMPEYIPPPEIEYYPNIPHGSIEDTSFYSTHLDNTRTIKVYLPPGYDQSVDEYPVVLVHDGLEYITFSKMDNIIDYLISEDKIRPVIAVFVPPVDRSPEYIDEKQLAFTDFITEEVMPWVDIKYRTINKPDSRAVIGSSAGGNISLWIGMNNTDNFGNVGAFSSYIEDDIQTTFANSPMLDLRIYMNYGKYDHLEPVHQSVNAFLPILEEKEYDYNYAEYPEGHSYGFWRAHVSDALIFFFPGTVASIGDKIDVQVFSHLYQNYPNPFNQYTRISYKIDKLSSVKLEVTNNEGRLVKVLVNGNKDPGKHEISWNGTDDSGMKLPAGIYFYCLYNDGNKFSCRKMVIKP